MNYRTDRAPDSINFTLLDEMHDNQSETWRLRTGRLGKEKSIVLERHPDRHHARPSIYIHLDMNAQREQQENGVGKQLRLTNLQRQVK